MSAPMTLNCPAATATLQDRLVELVELGRSLQLTPPAPPPLSLPSWPSGGHADIAVPKAIRRLVVAGTAALLVSHGYQLATAIVGAPERPSFVDSGSGPGHHPRSISTD